MRISPLWRWAYVDVGFYADCKALASRGLGWLSLAILVAWSAAAGTQLPCRTHAYCDSLPSPSFCNGVPYSHGEDGTCDDCWKCCLFPPKYNYSAATNAEGGVLSGACSVRCKCNSGRSCQRHDECGPGLFCMQRGSFQVPVCAPCTRCTDDSCAPKCPGGSVSSLLGQYDKSAACSLDSTLVDLAVFLAFALEPWREAGSNRAQVTPTELRRYLGSEAFILAAPNASTQLLEGYVNEALNTTVHIALLSAAEKSAAAMPLRAVAEAFLQGSRTLLCPKVNTSLPSSALPLLTRPGCPCNATLGATAFRCPAGYRCSQRSHLSMSADYLIDSALAQLKGECESCSAGQHCKEGTTASSQVLELQSLSVELDCPAGSFCPTPGDQLDCPVGHFCPARSQVPITCDYTFRLETFNSSDGGNGVEFIVNLWKNREPIRGNYCPRNSTVPNMACRAGFYCPNTSVQIPCPPGHYCKAQSTVPLKCPPLVSCPEGTADPDGRPLAGLIFGMVDAAVLFLYGGMLLGKLMVKRLVRGWNMADEEGDEAGGERPGAEANVGAAAEAGPSYPVTPCAFADNSKGDDWDDEVLTEPNEAPTPIKVLQGRYYSFKIRQRISIRFCNVRRDGRLQDVDGHFEAGKLNVVMGPSGCGKSTLIELLSGRMPSHELEAFQIDQMHRDVPDTGRRRKRICLSRTTYRSLLGFVPQEDILHADLTVRENLTYSARLKLPRSVSKNDVDSIIDETLDLLDMEHLRHSRTGSVERKTLSGGQRKRVSIGVEIVGKRPVMFMDEPTSGLDATTSYELCVLLSQMAKTFKINIVAVIHQPSYRCFRLFDKLLLLGRDGELNFHGRPRDCVAHFRMLGYRVVLKDCAETILDIVYNHRPQSPELSSSFSLPRGKIELLLKPIRNLVLEQSSEVPQVSEAPESVYSVAWSSDGRTLAIGLGDGSVQLCYAEKCECITVLKGHTNCVRSVAWRPHGLHGTHLASGGDDLSVRLWGFDPKNTARTGATGTLEAHTRVVTCVAWSPDGLMLASAGSWDKTVRLWDALSGHCTASLEHRSAVGAVAWSPDGRIASGSNDGAVWLWDLARCKSTATLKGHTDWVRSVSWSHNSMNLVSASSDMTLRLWEVSTGTCLAVLEGHRSYINTVAWCPGGGTTIASGSGDRSVRLWDAKTGSCVATIEGQRGDVTSVAWSPDGRLLALGCTDGSVKLWNSNSRAVTASYSIKLPQGAAPKGDHSTKCRLRNWLMECTTDSESQAPRDVQLACLIHRNLVKSSRASWASILLDVLYLQIAALIVGVIQGAGWGPSKVASNFVMAYLVLSMLSAVTHLRTFSVSRMVQLYERMAGVSVSATFLSSNVTDMTWIFLSPAIYFSIYYFITMPQARFVNLYIIGFLVCWWSSGLSYVISTSVMPQQHHTTVAVIGTLILGAFLHGLSPTIRSARGSVLEVILGFSFNRWAMEAAVIQEFKANATYGWNEIMYIHSSIGTCGIDTALGIGPSGNVTNVDRLRLFSLRSDMNSSSRYCDGYYSQAKIVLLCMGIGARVLAWIQMKYTKTLISMVATQLDALRKALKLYRSKCRYCRKPSGCCICLLRSANGEVGMSDGATVSVHVDSAAPATGAGEPPAAANTTTNVAATATAATLEAVAGELRDLTHRQSVTTEEASLADGAEPDLISKRSGTPKAKSKFLANIRSADPFAILEAQELVPSRSVTSNVNFGYAPVPGPVPGPVQGAGLGPELDMQRALSPFSNPFAHELTMRPSVGLDVPELSPLQSMPSPLPNGAGPSVPPQASISQRSSVNPFATAFGQQQLASHRSMTNPFSGAGAAAGPELAPQTSVLRPSCSLAAQHLPTQASSSNLLLSASAQQLNTQRSVTNFFPGTLAPRLPSQISGPGNLPSAFAPQLLSQTSGPGNFPSIFAPQLSSQTSGPGNFPSVFAPQLSSQTSGPGNFPSVFAPQLSSQTSGPGNFPSVFAPPLSSQTSGPGNFPSVFAPQLSSQTSGPGNFPSVFAQPLFPQTSGPSNFRSAPTQQLPSHLSGPSKLPSAFVPQASSQGPEVAFFSGGIASQLAPNRYTSNVLSAAPYTTSNNQRVATDNAAPQLATQHSAAPAIRVGPTQPPHQQQQVLVSHRSATTTFSVEAAAPHRHASRNPFSWSPPPVQQQLATRHSDMDVAQAGGSSPDFLPRRSVTDTSLSVTRGGESGALADLPSRPSQRNIPLGIGGGVVKITAFATSQPIT